MLFIILHCLVIPRRDFIIYKSIGHPPITVTSKHDKVCVALYLVDNINDQRYNCVQCNDSVITNYLIFYGDRKKSCSAKPKSSNFLLHSGIYSTFRSKVHTLSALVIITMNKQWMHQEND